MCIIGVAVTRSGHKFQWKGVYRAPNLLIFSHVFETIHSGNGNVRPLDKFSNFTVYKILSSNSRTTWTPIIIKKGKKDSYTLFMNNYSSKRCYLLKYIVLSWRGYISRCREFWILELPLKRSLPELVGWEYSKHLPKVSSHLASWSILASRPSWNMAKEKFCPWLTSHPALIVEEWLAKAFNSSSIAW